MKSIKDRILAPPDFVIYEAEKLVKNHLQLEDEWRNTNDRPFLLTNENAARIKALVETASILEDLHKSKS